MLVALLIPLALATLVYAVMVARAAMAARAGPNPEAVALGAVTNFFDTLGIGSFAPTMAWFKFRKLVPDRLIPCTMLVGHTLPVLAQAAIFLVLLGVLIDPVLLVGCIIALTMGGLIGVPLVTRAKTWVVQLVVGIALVVAASLYGLANLGLMPGGGAATSLPPALIITAIVANFVMGILLNFGVGNYAPTLVLLSLMGLDPRLCFPIMAAGAAFTAVGASARHIATGQLDLRIVVGMALGGIPAVLAAAFLVKSMSVETLRWLVCVVVLYAAVVMLKAAVAGWRESKARGSEPLAASS
jgi:uncharacterized membrane protein YfcA